MAKKAVKKVTKAKSKAKPKAKKAKKEKEIVVSVAEIVDYLRITGKFAAALKEVVIRKVTADAALMARYKVSVKELQKGVDAFRLVKNLSKAKSISTGR